MVRRQCSLAKINKWEDFRNRRQQALDNYAIVKKKILQTKMLVTTIRVHLVIERLHENFNIAKEEHRIRASKAFAAARLAVLWKVKLGRYGRRYAVDRQLHQVRHALTLHTLTVHAAAAAI